MKRVGNDSRLAVGKLGEQRKGCYRFQPALGHERYADFALQVPGKHNVANAMTAIAAVSAADVEPERTRAGFEAYRGAERRFQLLHECADHVVIDDYAHHPTEIEATLDAVRGRYPGWHLVAIYQPHQASRTRDHLASFGRILALADHSLVTQIYFARDCEEDRRTMSSRVVAQAIQANGGRGEFLPDFDGAIARAVELRRERIVYLVMGAGDVFRLAERLVQEL
jgi:UDP-N-acetylmuramate--alanine ligase